MARFARNSIGIFLLLFATALLGQEDKKPPSKPAPKPSADESAIRANVDAFVKAYNSHDAKAVAALFTAESQIIDEDGNTTQGRDAIENTFAVNFADDPQARIRVLIDSVRLIGSALAIETGHATVTAPGEEPDVTRYTAVHIKSKTGNWRMGFVHDTSAVEPIGSEQIKSLAWMIGEWIDESSDSVVLTSCKWSDNKNFILQDITVRREGRDAMHVSQRIGWDPLTKKLKAWLFDSEVGYGESYWTRDGMRWLAKATAVRKDGTTASMTNVYTLTGKDSYTWRSTDRVLGGDVLPSIEVKIVRSPPEATLSK